MTIKKQFEILEKLSKEYNGYYGLNTSRRIRTTINTIDYILKNLGKKYILENIKDMVDIGIMNYFML